MDPHWRPQHVNLMHPLIEYDRVGKLENFDWDLAKICKEAGIREVPVEKRNSKGPPIKTACTTGVRTSKGGSVRSSPGTSSFTATEGVVGPKQPSLPSKRL